MPGKDIGNDMMSCWTAFHFLGFISISATPYLCVELLYFAHQRHSDHLEVDCEALWCSKISETNIESLEAFYHELLLLI